MSILGAVIRLRPEDLPAVLPRARALPGVDVALDPGDGRLVLVIEDAHAQGTLHDATATLEAIAAWREVINTSLVYEYSGDRPHAADVAAGDAWRGRPGR